MKMRLKANNPLVIKAARERSRILKSLGKDVDAKTARIAKSTPAATRRQSQTGQQGKVVGVISVPEPVRDPARNAYFETGVDDRGVVGLDVGVDQVVEAEPQNHRRV